MYSKVNSKKIGSEIWRMENESKNWRYQIPMYFYETKKLNTRQQQKNYILEIGVFEYNI